MALCAGLDGRPTFGEVLEECVKLADEQQMRDALKGTGDMTKAEPTAVHATAEYLVEAGCRTFPLFRLPQSWLAGLAPRSLTGAVAQGGPHERPPDVAGPRRRPPLLHEQR